ncbi:MAG TPA: hypothetical protein VFX69_06240 [Steroidobacteraceae bacterium]|nr:hypothetical protein [Steroidobacteraceae bacterium]
MKRVMVAVLATLFATASLAQSFVPPARPGNPDVLRLGEEFTTLFVSCGTPVTPDCPNYLEPLPSPALVHYITLGGRATTNCSGWLFVERTNESGLQRTELMRLVLIAGAFDNLVLTLPKPIRLEAGDVIGLAVAQGTCAMLADFGVERLD